MSPQTNIKNNISNTKTTQKPQSKIKIAECKKPPAMQVA
jgi:hypothetical protein